MSAVLADTILLHHLNLCGAETILYKLFGQVVMSPTVFAELQMKNTPPLVRQWTHALPTWAVVQKPRSINTELEVDPGTAEAISLACEIKAVAILMDDRASRIAATHSGLAVVGMIGLLEQAASRQLLDLPRTLERLRSTNARLNFDLIQAALVLGQCNYVT